MVGRSLSQPLPFEKSRYLQEALRQKEKLSLNNTFGLPAYWQRILPGRFSYLDQIESIFGKGHSEEDERKSDSQAEVLRATGKDQSARKILGKSY